MPAVSVIIPVYGVEAYIEKCARSLFEQTLEDIEYIFVNDCTKDKSIEILQQVIEDYPNRKHQTKIIHHETNRGLPQARKTGIENSTGKYITHCDSDDWVENDMYSLMYEKAENENLDVIVCDVLKNDLDCTNVIKYFSKTPDNKDYLIKNLFSNTCLHNVGEILARHELYYQNFLYPTANIFEDLVFASQLLILAQKIGYLQKPLYHYVIHLTSMTNIYTEEQKIKQLIQTKKNLDVCLMFMNQNNMDDKYIQLIKFFHNLNFKTAIRTKKKREQSAQYNYPSLKKGIIFNRDISLFLKIRYIILSMNWYWLHDYLTNLTRKNPILKNLFS